MKRDMTHEEATLELAAAALGALTAADNSAVLSHVAHCIECAGELEALRTAAAQLAATVPAAPMGVDKAAAMRARLVARAAADAGSRAAQGQIPRSSTPVRFDRQRRWSLVPVWLAAAASLLIVLALTALARERRSNAALRVAVEAAGARDAATSVRVTELEKEVARRARAIAALTGPTVTIVELTAGGRNQPVARMFWEQSTNTWTLYAHHLAPPAAGKTYELWLVTARGTKIGAGTFAPTQSGDAQLSAVYPLDPGTLKAIAVTEEPVGGLPQPSGRIVILGAVRT
ncbi:MAG: hypothetical protein NVS4B3_21480 [Gemmatimonadaceae bacterium]